MLDLDAYDDRHPLSLRIRLTLTRPLSHTSHSDGNRANLMRSAVLDLAGNIRPVPVLNANAFRGWVLRRVGQMAVLRQLGLTVGQDTHSLLLSGGSTQKGSTMGNDLELYDKVARFYPPLALLGGAKPPGVLGVKNGQMLHGRLDISNFYCVCYEAARVLPGWALPPEVALARRQILESERNLDALRIVDGFRDVLETGTPEQIEAFQDALERHRNLINVILPSIRQSLKPAASLLADLQTVRADAAKDPQLKAFLSAQTPELLPDASPKKGKKAAESEASDSKDSSQMLVSDELLAPGNQLVGSIDVRPPGLTAVEEGYLVYALQEWGRNPVIGGKAAKGCGGFPKIEVWFQSGSESGQYLVLDNGIERLGDRAQNARSRWEDYLAAFQDYLDSAAQDSRVQDLLGS